MTAPSGIDVLDARLLSEASPVLLHEALKRLCDAYEAWVEIQEDEVDGLPSRHREAARSNLDNCRAVLGRMRESADIICSDDRLGNAFRLANLAMLVQHGWDPDKARRGFSQMAAFSAGIHHSQRAFHGDEIPQGSKRSWTCSGFRRGAERPKRIFA